ncbi:Protein of unknown function [Lactobacillus delbrueckii subsp. bulgaricus]|nr:Protein of unknown function [Lactobacillus delbrueckii subsp. bulgaricus]
MLRNRPGLSS